MRTNGYIQLKRKGESTLDDNGLPYDSGNAVFLEKTPALIRAVSQKSMGRYADGEYLKYSYEIVLEGKHDLGAESIKVVIADKDVGVHQVVSCNEVHTQGRTKLYI